MAPKPQQARIQEVAPLLRALVEQHENNTYTEGVEALNAKMMGLIEGADLVDEEVKHTSKAGTHPDNREGAMIMPMDSQDLLLKFFENGYNHSLWDALALRIPQGEVGDSWRAKNLELVEGADGQLASIEADTIEIVTGRGSHGTSALRMVNDGNVKSVHPELADSSGHISKSKLLEAQPSWREPLEKGVLYKIIPGELELAVPGLLACLSRIGNASHNVYRHQTALQLCARIHSIVKNQKGKELNEIQIAKQACVGNGGMSMLPQVQQLTSFVIAWSGGANAHILRDLELYERACTLKRKLAASDLHAIANIDLLHASRYIKATWPLSEYILFVFDVSFLFVCHSFRSYLRAC